jgi:hypothetical protein
MQLCTATPRFGATLPATFGFDYPNVAAMTRFVANQLGAAPRSNLVADTLVAPSLRRESTRLVTAVGL